MTTNTRAIERLEETLPALADPTRLAMLVRLRERDQCACHIIEDLGLKQSVVSHHLGILRRAGIVTTYRHRSDRRWLYYRLDRQRLAEMTAQLGWLQDDSEYDPTPRPCPIDLEQA